MESSLAPSERSLYDQASSELLLAGRERPFWTYSEMYRARQLDAEQNRPHYANPISCPVLAVGGQAYLDFFAGRRNPAPGRPPTEIRGHPVSRPAPAR
jgi:hypothetical protein